MERQGDGEMQAEGDHQGGEQQSRHRQPENGYPVLAHPPYIQIEGRLEYQRGQKHKQNQLG